MKKLSFIMAVLMILMCMPIMAISAADEVVAPDANAPEDVKEIHKNLSEAYWLYEYESDEAAIADGAFGRFCKEGGFGYAKTWTAVAAQAQDCGATVFYVIKDRVDVNTIGRDTTFDVGGRNLVIDGVLGQTTSEYGFTLVSDDRFLHANADTANGKSSIGRSTGSLTFKNIYLDGKAATGSLIQLNADAIIPAVTFDNVYIDAPNVSNGLIFWATGKYVVNNVHMVLPKKDSQAVRLDGGKGQDVTITNSVISGIERAVIITASNSKLFVENTEITIAASGRAAIQYNGGSNNELTVLSGKFTGGFGFVIQNAPNLVANIYGGTYTATANNGIQYQGTADGQVNVYGGLWNAKNMAISTSAASNKEINIYGGTFTGQARMIRLGGSKVDTLNIYGGNFVVTNFDQSLDAFSSTPTPSFGVIFTELNNVVNVYGGTFAAYKDNGVTLATDTAFIAAWQKDENSNATVNVYGGSFSGGKCFVVNGVYSGDKASPWNMEKSTFYYYTEGTNGVTLEPKAVQGASVRLDKNNSGLRFTATIDALAIKFIEENLVKEGTELSYGTMIVPSNYVKYAGGELTMEAFDKAGKAYLNIEAKDGVVVNEDGSVTINAAMVNIKKENYDRDFIAVAYIKYTDKTGAEVIKYATNVTLAAFSRNVQEVAHAALADVLATSAGTYTNKVDGYYVWNQNARKYEYVTGTAYSRYNAEQLAVLKSYIIAE